MAATEALPPLPALQPMDSYDKIVTGDHNDDLAVNRWDIFFDNREGAISKKQDDGPRTIEITYAPTKGNSQVTSEIVFEDPSDLEKRPRLLVSLQSVLALKALCEREFHRVEVIAGVLKHCRTAYFKEINYLREQLKRATRPGAVHDGIDDYEVYWYDPPEYIDSDLKLFLQDCIRLTNKKLIEENYELIQKLKALGGHAGGDDEDIIRMIRTLGPGGFVRKMYGFLCTLEHGSAQKRKDFEIAVTDLLRKDDGSDSDAENALQEKIRKLLAQIEKLKKQNEESEALRKRVAELEAELQRGGAAAVAAEAARADAERARADALEAANQTLTAELDMMRNRLKELQDEQNGLAKGVGQLAQRVDKVVYQMTPNAKPGTASIEGLLNPLEISVSTLEGCMGSVMSKLRAAGSGSSDADRKAISDLTAQLKTSQEAEAKLKEQIARMLEEAKKLKAERDAEAKAAAMANAKLEALRSAGGASSAELAQMANELRALKEANEKMAREIEDIGRENSKRIKQLEKALAELEKEAQEMREKLKGSADAGKLAAAEAYAEELAMRLSHAEDKIFALKAEIKRLKAMHGMQDEDGSDSDSNYDRDLPLFLMSYVKRTRSSAKPRWQHLSDDAKFGRQKRDFIFANAHSTDDMGAGDLGPEAAAEALAFINQDSEGHHQQPQANRRAPRHRTHSTVIWDNQEPVLTALRARGVVNYEMEAMLSETHVKDVALRTGHPVHQFEQIAKGRGNPTIEAALAFRGAHEAAATEDLGSQAKEQRRRKNQRAQTSPYTGESTSQNFPSAAAMAKPVPAIIAYSGSAYAQAAGVPKGTSIARSTAGDAVAASLESFNRGRDISAVGIAQLPSAGICRPAIPAESGGRSNSPRSPGPVLVQGRSGGSRQASRDIPAPAAIQPRSSSPGTGRRELAGAQVVGQSLLPVVVMRSQPNSQGQSDVYTLSPSRRQAASPTGTSAGFQMTSPLEAVGNSLSGGPASPTSQSAGVRLGALEAVASSVPRGLDGALGRDQSPGPRPMFSNTGFQPRNPSPISTEQQSEVCKQEFAPPDSPSGMQFERIRTGGLSKMETPTKWSVDSRLKSPSPVRIDETGMRASTPVAAQRLARSRPPSQGTPSPGRSPVSSRSPARSPQRALPREEAPVEHKYPPTIADMVAHQQRAAPMQVQMNEAAQSTFKSTPTMIPPTIRARTSPGVGVSSKRSLHDPLAEASTSSIGTLPPQDSVGSTVASMSATFPCGFKSGKQAQSKEPASRGRGPPTAVGAAPTGSLRSALSTADGSSGFPNGACPSATFPGTGGNRMSSSNGFAKGPPASEFSPGLGFGDRRAGTAQAPRGGALQNVEGLDGPKPSPVPSRRLVTAGAQREVTWVSKSAGSLPLTNTGGRNAAMGSPMRPRRRLAPGSDDKAAKVELASANSEGHLPELLPAFKPGRIHKGPKAPAWLLPAVAI